MNKRSHSAIIIHHVTGEVLIQRADGKQRKYQIRRYSIHSMMRLFAIEDACRHSTRGPFGLIAYWK